MHLLATVTLDLLFFLLVDFVRHIFFLFHLYHIFSNFFVIGLSSRAILRILINFLHHFVLELLLAHLSDGLPCVLIFDALNYDVHVRLLNSFLWTSLTEGDLLLLIAAPAGLRLSNRIHVLFDLGFYSAVV